MTAEMQDLYNFTPIRIQTFFFFFFIDSDPGITSEKTKNTQNLLFCSLFLHLKKNNFQSKVAFTIYEYT